MRKLGVEITREAETDYRAAVDYYATESLEPARAFASAFRAAIALLRERPLIGTPYEEGTRRKVLSKHPFAIIYDVQPELLTVIAVAHHSRDPQYWLDRVRKHRAG